jgi:hypothetical protein
MEESSRLFMERNEETAAIIKPLSEGLAAYPENIHLLESRANIYCSRGMLPECREDSLRLLQLTSGRAEVRVMLCMLDEYEGGDRETYEACYRKVADQLAARPPAATPDKVISDKFNYVFALLMARAPEAEKEKTDFLSSVEADPRAWIYYGILDSFDRKQALREIFGEPPRTHIEYLRRPPHDPQR